MHEHTLRPWTWVLPLIVLLLATYASLPFITENKLFSFYFASALTLPMALWWGPRVLFAAFFNSLLACVLLNLPTPHLYPLFALPTTLEAFIAWALVRERLKQQGPWVSTPRNLLLLIMYGIVIPSVISAVLLQSVALFNGFIEKDQFLSLSFLMATRHLFLGLMLTVPLVVFLSPVLYRKKMSLFPSSEKIFLPKLSSISQYFVVIGLGITMAIAIFLPPQETWSFFALALLGISLWSGLFYTLLCSSWMLFITGLLYKTQTPVTELDPHSLLLLSTIAISSILCGSTMTYMRSSEAALKRTESNLREAKEEALEASQAKTDFLERMSHELRTPLSSVLGTLELLKETDLNPEQQNYLKLFSHAGENLKALINDLLDYANIEVKKVILEEAPYDLRDTLKSVVEILQIKAEERGILFTLDLPEDFPYAQIGDGTRLRQILFNLLGNSIKFSQSSEISLILSLEDEQILITVKDSGVGIAKDAQTTTRHGIGLIIARNLSEAMGGNLHIQSQSGRGTTIKLTLPNKASERIDLKPALSPDMHFLERSEEKFHILLVDDAEDNRILIKYYLKNFPFDFVEAENGEEAIEHFKKQKFDLVFMDMQMPKMTGYKATEIIRFWEEENRKRHTPIIALTATAIPEELKKAIRAGCDQYLVKPTSKKQILKVLSERLKPSSPHISGTA